MLSRCLAFRPASVVERLDPRSQACPLSTRELLAPVAELGLAVPVVVAPIEAVARGALVAAKEAQSALGLAMPRDGTPEPWFAAVTRAADEVAAGLPIFLCGEVVVAGEGAMEVERALHEAWRLVAAGFTHVAVDVAAVAPGERGRVVAEVAAAGIENGICVDVVMGLAEGSQARNRAAALLEELAERGTPTDLASVRCPAPETVDDARLQAAALARVCEALSGVPVMRRGPATAELLDLLRGSPVKLCEDGGAASARALEGIAAPQVPPSGDEPRTRASGLERAASELAPAALELIEARTYMDALELMERLGSSGSALEISRALEQRLERE